MFLSPLTECPSKRPLVARAPRADDGALDDALEYFEEQLIEFPGNLFPDENATVHCELGKLKWRDYLDKSHRKALDLTHLAAALEKVLFHFMSAMKQFSREKHPDMYAVVNILATQALRERYYLVAAKTGVLTKHGRGATKAGSLKKALDQAFEALNTLRAMRLKGNLEYAVACVEAGILYLLQLEDEGDPVNAGVHRDEALIQLETAQTQFEAFIRNHQKAAEGGSGGVSGGGGGTDGGGGSGAGTARSLLPGAGPAVFPPHVQLLLQGKTRAHFEGLIAYLHGCVYHATGLSSDLRDAYFFFTQSVRGGMLPAGVVERADAHFRMSKIILAAPQVLDDGHPPGGGASRPGTAQQPNQQQLQVRQQPPSFFPSFAVTSNLGALVAGGGPGGPAAAQLYSEQHLHAVTSHLLKVRPI